MSNQPFFVTAKVVSEEGDVFSFANSGEHTGYCICIHTQYEKIYFFELEDEYEVIDVVEGVLSDLFGGNESFQSFKDSVMKEALFIKKLKSQNKEATEMNLIGPVNPGAKGSQFLWKKGNNYIVTSWATFSGRTEILGFMSNEEGKIKSWAELDVLYMVADLIDNHRFVAQKSFEKM